MWLPDYLGYTLVFGSRSLEQVEPLARRTPERLQLTVLHRRCWIRVPYVRLDVVVRSLRCGRVLTSPPGKHRYLPSAFGLEGIYHAYEPPPAGIPLVSYAPQCNAQERKPV